MNIRKALKSAIGRELVAKGKDAGLVDRQLEGMPLAWLCAMSEATPVIVENRAVYTCGPYKYALVLWREEYKPQPIERRQEQYNAAPMIMSDLPAYNCPITGKQITSRSKHRENLKRHGCEVAEPSTPRSTWREEKQADHDRKKAVHDAWTQLNYH